LVLLAATLAVGLAGCGAGGGSTSVEASSPASTVPRSKAKAPAATTSPASGRRHDRSGSDEKTGHAAGQQPSRPAGTRHRHAAGTRHRAAEACPDGLTRAQCKSLVAEIKQQKSPGSPSLSGPHHCLDVMSRAECEAMLAAQQAAMRAAGHPIVLKECLAHPTPECKAALESVLEAQYAASQKAGR